MIRDAEGWLEGQFWICCVTLGELPNLSEPVFSSLKWGIKESIFYENFGCFQLLKYPKAAINILEAKSLQISMFFFNSKFVDGDTHILMFF